MFPALAQLRARVTGSMYATVFRPSLIVVTGKSSEEEINRLIYTGLTLETLAVLWTWFLRSITCIVMRQQMKDNTDIACT